MFQCFLARLIVSNGKSLVKVHCFPDVDRTTVEKKPRTKLQFQLYKQRRMHCMPVCQCTFASDIFKQRVVVLLFWGFFGHIFNTSSLQYKVADRRYNLFTLIVLIIFNERFHYQALVYKLITKTVYIVHELIFVGLIILTIPV